MYTFKERVRYSETDDHGELTLGAMLNLLQDCSVFHSEDVHAGISQQRRTDRVWMLSSWQIVLKKRPRLFERIEIGTAAYQFKGPLGLRNFRITSEDGEEYVAANSAWCLVGLSDLKIVRITEEDSAPYTIEPPIEMDYAPRKITLSKQQLDEGVRYDPLTVLPEYIDTNHHVNNGQYIVLASRFLAEDFRLRQIRAEYRHQAVLGDIMYPVIINEGSKVTTAWMQEDGQPYAIVEFSE